MKLKSKIITIVVASFLLAGTNNIQAQGFFNNDKPTAGNTTNKSSGGIFRDDDDNWWDDGDEDRPQDPNGDSPIGEGIIILSLLAGGYTLVKRNVRRKHED